MFYVLIYGGCVFLVIGAFILCMMFPANKIVPIKVSFPVGLALAAAGCALIMTGITYHNQRVSYTNDWLYYADDCSQFKRGQKRYHKDDRKFKHADHQLHLDSVSGIHDPKIMNMTASQAHDFFIKRTRLQKKVKNLKKDCQNDLYTVRPKEIQLDIHAIKQDRQDIFVKNSNLLSNGPEAAFNDTDLKYNHRHPYLLTSHSLKLKLNQETDSFDHQLKRKGV